MVLSETSTGNSAADGPRSSLDFFSRADFLPSVPTGMGFFPAESVALLDVEACMIAAEAGLSFPGSILGPAGDFFPIDRRELLATEETLAPEIVRTRS